MGTGARTDGPALGKNGAHRLGPMQTLPGPMRHIRRERAGRLLRHRRGFRQAAYLLQRLARAGFQRRWHRSRSVLGHRERDWVSDEAGSHKLYWKDLRITGGSIRWLWARTIAAKEWAADRCTGRRSRRAFIPRIFAVYTRGRRGRGLADDLLGAQALLRVAGAGDAGCRVRHGIPGAIRTAILTARIRMGGVGNVLIRGCTKLGIRVVPVARWPSCPDRAAIVRIASIAAFAFRAARSAPRPAR